MSRGISIKRRDYLAAPLLDKWSNWTTNPEAKRILHRELSAEYLDYFDTTLEVSLIVNQVLLEDALKKLNEKEPTT